MSKKVVRDFLIGTLVGILFFAGFMVLSFLNDPESRAVILEYDFWDWVGMVVSLVMFSVFTTGFGAIVLKMEEDEAREKYFGEDS